MMAPDSCMGQRVGPTQCQNPEGCQYAIARAGADPIVHLVAG